MVDIPPTEDRFRSNVIALCSYIHDEAQILTSSGCEGLNPNVIQVAYIFLNGCDKMALIDGFIERSKLHWDNIKECKEEFFSDKAEEIFSELPLKHVFTFREVIFRKDSNGKAIIAQEKRDIFWEFFHSLVKICIKYIH